MGKEIENSKHVDCAVSSLVTAIRSSRSQAVELGASGMEFGLASPVGELCEVNR